MMEYLVLGRSVQLTSSLQQRRLAPIAIAARAPIAHVQPGAPTPIAAH